MRENKDVQTITLDLGYSGHSVEIEVYEDTAMLEVINLCEEGGYLTSKHMGDHCYFGFQIVVTSESSQETQTFQGDSLNQPISACFKIGETKLGIYPVQATAGPSLADLWNGIYPVIQQVATLVGLASTTIAFVNWLRKKFIKREEPKRLLKTLSSRKYWTSIELAENLDISKNDAKRILKGFGFEWDKCNLVYQETEKTKSFFTELEMNSDTGNGGGKENLFDNFTKTTSK